MTLRDPNPVLKVTAFLKSNISKTRDKTQGQSYYRTVIRNYTYYIEWYHFQWRWPRFQGHDIFWSRLS